MAPPARPGPMRLGTRVTSHAAELLQDEDSGRLCAARPVIDAGTGQELSHGKQSRRGCGQRLTMELVRDGMRRGFECDSSLLLPIASIHPVVWRFFFSHKSILPSLLLSLVLTDSFRHGERDAEIW
jgi:hypothetical protein